MCFGLMERHDSLSNDNGENSVFAINTCLCILIQPASGMEEQSQLITKLRQSPLEAERMLECCRNIERCEEGLTWSWPDRPASHTMQPLITIMFLTFEWAILNVRLICSSATLSPHSNGGAQTDISIEVVIVCSSKDLLGLETPDDRKSNLELLVIKTVVCSAGLQRSLRLGLPQGAALAALSVCIKRTCYVAVIFSHRTSWYPRQYLTGKCLFFLFKWLLYSTLRISIL